MRRQRKRIIWEKNWEGLLWIWNRWKNHWTLFYRMTNFKGVWTEDIPPNISCFWLASQGRMIVSSLKKELIMLRVEETFRVTDWILWNELRFYHILPNTGDWLFIHMCNKRRVVSFVKRILSILEWKFEVLLYALEFWPALETFHRACSRKCVYPSGPLNRGRDRFVEVTHYFGGLKRRYDHLKSL